MKISQKVLSVLVSILLLFSAISCANDSVDENTKPEPKPETNKPQIELPQIKDGSYEIKLEPILLPITYNEVVNNKTTEGTMVIEPSMEGVKPISKCVIDKCSKGNGTYYYYNFDFPKPVGNDTSSENKENVKVKGVVLNKTSIDKITIVVTNEGNNIELANKDISFFGFITDFGGTSILSIEDSANNQLVMIPKYDISKYVGTWQKEINPECLYTIEIKDDGSGSYDFGTDKKGKLNVYDSKNGGIIIVNTVDKATIGNALIFNKKLVVNPPKDSTLLGEITEFTKKITIINNL